MNVKNGRDWRRRSERGHFVGAPKRYESLLIDTTVKKWVSHLKENPGWRSTVPSFLRTLYRFSEYSRKDPKELVAAALSGQTAKQRGELTPADAEVINVAQKFVDERVTAGKLESARHAKACLSSFFKANHVALNLASIPKVPKKAEVIPTKEQVYEMADYTSSLRDRAIILCMYQSGLRVASLRNLNYGHVREQIEKNRIPVRVPITSAIAERSLPREYFAFFGAEACNALNTYLRDRKRKIQEKRAHGTKVQRLTSSSPLFASEGKNVPFGGRMAISSIWRVIKNAAEKAGLRKEGVWPSLLRKAYEAEVDRAPLDQETKRDLTGRPVSGKTYDVNDVEQQYSLLRLGRTKLDKLAIIRDFVRSLGIEDVEAKIKTIRARAPRMSEEAALGVLVRTEVGGIPQREVGRGAPVKREKRTEESNHHV